MKVVTICGSMKFFEQMNEIAQKLELEKQILCYFANQLFKFINTYTTKIDR